MPRFSAFTPMGALKLSSAPSHVEEFYRLLPSLWGSQIDFSEVGSYVEEKLYAVARMCSLMLGELEHAGNQANPLKAFDLLPLLELDFLISPGPTDTVPTRQKNVAAAYLLARGASASNVVALVRAAVGAAFLAYIPNPNGATAVVAGAANNGSGAIRITATNTYATGDKVLVNGVVGTTEANGTWPVTVISGAAFDLFGSTFTHAYVSGGNARRLPTVFPVDPTVGQGHFGDVRQPAKFLRLVDPVSGIVGTQQWCAYQALDVSGVPQLTWSAGSTFASLQLLVPTVPNATGFFYQCTTPGISGAIEPTWPTTPGTTVTDGAVVWTCISTIAPALVVGDQVVMDPGNTRQMETVTVTAVSGARPSGSMTTPGYLYFRAVFQSSHDIDSPMTTGSVPYWWSTQRLNYIVLTAAGATDAPTRAKVDALLAKVLRGVSTWALVEPSSTTFLGGTLGPLSAGLPMGTSPIGSFAFSNST